MGLTWQAVESSVISAEAYESETRTIYVRYHNGAEWGYGHCPRKVWQEFTAPGQSRGRYLNHVLKAKPAHRLS